MTNIPITRDQQSRWAHIKLLSLDVDGVMTDGGLYYTDEGVQFRKFNVKDGLGIKRLIGAGVVVCIISASTATSTLSRAEHLGIEHVRIGSADKLADLHEIASKLGIGVQQVAHMGDDLTDVAVMKAVGVALTVADAVPEVIAVADYVTQKGGGCGAVREICDLIVAAHNDA